ncbi:nucleotidyltransferase family protein [Tenacibaculum xiamenense]|uniref:nucleotidyltransferase family protein n=1 Tax=Tenacibaculum xiamenense TaxID=1261553 RepID=UPI0038961EE7
MKTAIIILAAGMSSRMGTAKQLLPYKHTTLLGWTVEQAMNITNTEVICVTGANRQQVEDSIFEHKLNFVYNAQYQEGLSSSISAGINYIISKDFDNALIILADQPFVLKNYLKNIISKSESNPNKIIASNYGKRIGVPALFPRKYYQYLTTMSGDKGAKELLNKLSDNIFKMSEVNLVDIDTQEEYEQYAQ